MSQYFRDVQPIAESMLQFLMVWSCTQRSYHFLEAEARSTEEDHMLADASFGRTSSPSLALTTNNPLHLSVLLVSAVANAFRLRNNHLLTVFFLAAQELNEFLQPSDVSGFLLVV